MGVDKANVARDVRVDGRQATELLEKRS